MNDLPYEVAGLREAVSQLVTIISASAPGEDRRIRRFTYLLIIGGPLLFALTLGLGVRDHFDRLARDKLIHRGISCLLADMDDHRHTNQFAHEKIAEKLGVKINQPDIVPLTREQAAQLKKECETFVRYTLGSALPDLAHPEGEKP